MRPSPILTLLLVSSLHAAVGDPQLATDHPWYPGELAMSSFDRLAATQWSQYVRTTGEDKDSDHHKALANVAACYELGFTIFDSSAAGLGGCPYAVGAGGNLATEDLVAFFEREGVATGVDLSALAQASLPILAVLGRAPAAKAQQAVLAELRQKSVAPQAEA